jgi:hypothetical protein
MMELPIEVVVMSVRSQIGIERCVRNYLDEPGPFRQVLIRIDKAVREL